MLLKVGGGMGVRRQKRVSEPEERKGNMIKKIKETSGQVVDSKEKFLCLKLVPKSLMIPLTGVKDP